MLLVALFVSVGFVATGVLPVQQYLDRGNQVAEAQETLDALVEQNSALEDSAGALLTDSEIERVAREQYGFVQPGEVGYVVVTPDADGEAVGTQTPEPITESDTRGFFQRFFDFITGRDTASDG
jgi:cell division protein FtsB